MHKDEQKTAVATERDLDKCLDVAIQAAKAAGEVLLARRGQVAVEYKAGHGDLVTEADRDAEAAVIDVLRKHFPTHGIVGEESGEHTGDDAQRSRWFVDPLDGTTNYAQGLPLFATSIALEQKGQLQIGVIHMPVFNATYSAIRGRGARCNDEPIYVSKADDLRRTLLVTGHAHDLGESVYKNVSLLNYLVNASRGVRMLGSAAVNLAYVAEGIFEAYWAPMNEVWDVAAGVLLVQEAGGKVTDMDGGLLDLLKPRLLASNGYIHDDMVAALRKYTDD